AYVASHSQQGRCSYGQGGQFILWEPRPPGRMAGASPPRGAGSLLIDAAHGGGMKASVHIQDLTGDTRGQIRAQEGAGVADFLDGHVATQRGAVGVVGEHLAEALDAGSGQSADRAGGDGVDADAVRTQAGGQVAYAGFQAGLGHAHDVVVGHGAYRTEIGQGQQVAVALLQRFAAGLGQGDEAVGADVVGDLEAIAGGDFSEVAVQLVAGCKAHRMHDAVDPFGPFLLQLGEYLLDLRVVSYVTGKAHFGAGAPAFGKLFDAALELVVLVGEGQFGAFAVHGRGDARGNGQLAGYTNDEYALSAKKSHVLFLFLWASHRGRSFGYRVGEGSFEQLTGVVMLR